MRERCTIQLIFINSSSTRFPWKKLFEYSASILHLCAMSTNIMQFSHWASSGPCGPSCTSSSDYDVLTVAR